MKKILFTMFSTMLFAIVAVSCNGKSASQDGSEQQKENNMIVKEGPKSVLILSSSPRRGGNSETLCEQFAKGARETGNRVEMLNINDYDIRFFNKTEYVRGEQTDDDDAVRIIRKMAAADVIVLSSPVYFYSMTGQMKTLIDRVYNYEKDIQNKVFYYIITSTDRQREALDGTIMGFRGFIHCLYGSVERGIVCGNGARERGAILKHPAMQEAYEMGKGV